MAGHNQIFKYMFIYNDVLFKTKVGFATQHDNFKITLFIIK